MNTSNTLSQLRPIKLPLSPEYFYDPESELRVLPTVSAITTFCMSAHLDTFFCMHAGLIYVWVVFFLLRGMYQLAPLVYN